MTCAPIALFVYNRPDHTRRTVEALKKNYLASESDLIVFSDGSKTDEHADKVMEVRQYIHQIDGFKSITIVEHEINFGLARSIISGVTKTVEEYGRIIVLEDDMVTSSYFLTYMNEALEKYEDDDRVVSIHGYVYPVVQPLPEAFFLRGADCWGWATWSRGWACFNRDGQFLLDELKRRQLIRAFDFNGTYLFSKMLEEQIKGSNDSWAVRWYASAFLADKLTLYPGRSLVHNIGNDNSGRHCGESAGMDVNLSSTAISLNDLNRVASQEGRQAFEYFFRQGEMGLLGRLARKVRALARVISR
ncbi:MAG: glycosyltransferase [Gallionellaceae bacterium]